MRWAWNSHLSMAKNGLGAMKSVARGMKVFRRVAWCVCVIVGWKMTAQIRIIELSSTYGSEKHQNWIGCNVRL